jgi:bacterioferritin-associated ferredoxin
MFSALAWAGSQEQVIVKNKTGILRNVVRYHGLADCGGSHNAIPGSVNCGDCRDQLKKLLTSEEGQYSMGVVRTTH